MNFKKLEELKSELTMEELDKIDKYLALTPKSYRDRLQVGRIARDLQMEFSQVEKIIDRCCEIGIMTERYLLTCPKCGLALKIADLDELVSALKSLSYCYGCEYGSENLDMKLTTDDIYPIYKIN